MSNHVSARDIGVMRHARHVVITEHDGNAVLTFRTTPSWFRLLSRVLPARLLHLSTTVPIASESTALGASPSRGGTPLAAVIRHARRNPNWVALVDTVRAGNKLEVQWERDGYALLLVRSDDDFLEDQFAFRATRRSRRALNETGPRAVRRLATRALATAADIAGRVPVPHLTRSTSGNGADGGDATTAADTAPTPVAVGDDG